MTFPTNLAEAREIIKKHRHNAGTLKAQLGVTKRSVEQEVARSETIAEVLNGLAHSWQESDPGKYRDVYFFVQGAEKKRVVVREFLSDESVICKNKSEWDEYCNNRKYYGANHERVPIWFSVVSLADITKHACPRCTSKQPLIEHYVQTYDSPDGDEWLKEYLVLCLACEQVSAIERRMSDYRF